MADIVGKTIKGYEIVEHIGAGGFGSVYKAYQTIIQREVAIKVIIPEHASQPEFIRSFEAEAQLVARLEHPFIVPLFDFWRDPDGAYLVMRWLRGGSLRNYLEKNQPSIEEVISFLNTISSALAVAHRNNVVHRDLKPDNILLDEEKTAYLTDFGIAKPIGHQTTDDRVSGSLRYISPEQLQSQPPQPQMDIYSLGMMLFEMLTGRHPFESRSPSELIMKHLTEPMPDIRTFRDDLPDAIVDVIDRATAKEAENRYADARELAAEFRQIFQQSAIIIDSSDLDLSDVANPYKGLRAFQEADAADFFGREILVDQLLGRMTENHPMSRFLAVVGPSGSGKSSVVRAGLVPAIRNGQIPGSEKWFVVDMVPGVDPVRQLEAILLSVALRPPSRLYQMLTADEGGLLWAVDRVMADVEGDLLIVIDQFEELFTMVEDEQVRNHFLDLLLAAVAVPDSRLRLIITLRADFIDKPLEYIEFGELLRRRIEFVLPLSAEEIERAITGPAQRVGLNVDTDLVAAVVSDVRDEPGALPLLQYALTEVFERREGNTITLEAYRDSGGVLGALARRAEEVYTSLKPEETGIARQLLLRMVTLGEGTEDTRRRTSRSELASITDDNETLQSVLDQFGKYRLLTFDVDPGTREPMIEVAHEALIREWERLRHWLDDSRADVRLQRLLATAANEWRQSNRDAGYLLTGTRLAQYEEWADTTDIALTHEEIDYLRESLAESQRQEALEAQRKEREVATAKRAQNFQRASAVLAIVGVLAVIATIAAAVQAASALTQVNEAQSFIATADYQVAIVGETLTPADMTIQAGNNLISTAQEAQDIALENVATAQAQVTQVGELADDAATQIAVAGATIIAADTQVAQVAPTVNAANSQVNAANTQVAQVEPTVNSANTQVAGIQPTVNSANTQVAEVIPTLNAANLLVDAAQTQVSGVQPTVNAAETQVAGVQPTVDSANTQVAQVVPTVEAANIQLNFASTQVAGVQPTVDSANTQVAQVVPTINAANTQVADSLIFADDANTQVAGVQPTVDAAQTQVAQVEPTLNAANLLVDAAGTQVAGVEPTVDAANTQVAAVVPTLIAADALVAAVVPTVNAANTQAADALVFANAANTQVAGVQPTVDAANTQVAQIEPTLDAANVLVNSAATQVAGVQPTVDTANTQVAVIAPTVDAAQTQAIAAATIVAGVQPTIDSANTQVAGVAPTLAAANTQVAGVQPTVDAAGTKVAEAQPTLTAVAVEVQSQRNIAESLGLIRSAQQLLITGNPDLAIRLVLEAYNLNPSLAEPRRILNEAIPLTARLNAEINSGGMSVFSRDGQYIALSDGANLTIWDMPSRQIFRELNAGATIRSGVYSPDSQFLALGLDNGQVLIYNVIENRLQYQLSGHTGPVTTIDYHPTDAQVVSGGQDETVIVWDTGLGREIARQTGYGNPVNIVAYQGNGGTVFAFSMVPPGDDDPSNFPRVGVIQAIQNNIFFRNPREYRGITKDGLYAFTGGDSSDFLKLWNAGNLTELRTFRLGNFSTDYINFFDISDDGRFMLVFSESRLYDPRKENYIVTNRYTAIWDISTGGEILKFQSPEAEVESWTIHSLAFSHDGTMALTGGLYGPIYSVSLWNTGTGQEIRRFTGHDSTIFEVEFSADDNYAFSRSAGNLRVWDIKALETNTRNQLDVSVASFGEIGLSTDGSRAYIAYDDKSLAMWNTETKQQDPATRFTTGLQTVVAFSPTAPQAIASGADGVVLWDLTTSTFINRLTEINPRDVQDVSFSPDGQLAVFGGTSQTFVWNIALNSRTSTIPSPATKVTISGNNEYVALATGSAVRIFDLFDGTEDCSYSDFTGPVNSISFSPTGDKVIAAIGEPDKTLLLIDRANCRLIFEMYGHLDAVNSVTFNPDGFLALSGGDDRRVILWDVITGLPLQEFTGHLEPVKQVVFSRDGKFALSASNTVEDGILRWTIRTTQDTVLWTRANRYIVDLTCSQRDQYSISPRCINGVVPELPTSTPFPTLTPIPTSTLRPTFTPTMTPIPMGTIFSDGAMVNVRSAAGSGFSLVTQVAPGTVVEILQIRADISWMEIKLPDGLTGWVISGAIRQN